MALLRMRQRAISPIMHLAGFFFFRGGGAMTQGKRVVGKVPPSKIYVLAVCFSLLFSGNHLKKYGAPETFESFNE